MIKNLIDCQSFFKVPAMKKRFVIASVSEAIHSFNAHGLQWIATSLLLLAMTCRYAIANSIDSAILSRIENLKQNIKLNVLEKIAKGFDKTPAEFLLEFENRG